MPDDRNESTGRFDIGAIAASLPPASCTRSPRTCNELTALEQETQIARDTQG
jgi:hypothetical protein